MKRILLAGAAFAAMTSASAAADLGFAPEPVPVDIWSGFFVGVQVGYAWKDVDATIDEGGPFLTEDSFSSDEFVGGLYYGRNWQLDNNFVIGLDSSISYMGLDEDEGDFSYEANLLGLSRLKLGFAFDNTMLFVAGGLATTWLEVETAVGDDDDDSFAFGWTVGAGVEHKFTDNWSARIEYAYFSIEEDDISLDIVDTQVEADLDGHLVRAGIAYHF